MTRFLKKIGIYYEDFSKDEAPIIFSKLFTISLLADPKYNYILNEQELQLAPLITKYLKNVINTFKKTKNEHQELEFNRHNPCPCGSGKIYENCCKKKHFKWITDNDEIKRQIPLHEEVIKDVDKLKQETENILERKLLNQEKIFRFLSGPNLDMNKLVRDLRNLGIPENILYASYKTGLSLSEFNINLLPDYEYNNWNKALKEYEKYTKNNKNGLNYIKFINQINKQLKNTWQKYLNDSFSILNIFINDVKENLFKSTTFEINDINNFAVFCVRRVIKNGEALLETLQNNHYEVSMSIVRMLYEDLININVYINNEEMFNKHIMPLVLIEKGVYQKLTDDKGNISNKTAINLKTNEKINYSITLKDLSKKSREEYKLLYEQLFRDLSAYTHLNITVKNTYFSNPDPFFEIERTNIAGILGLFFINQIIYELATISKISDFTYRDLLFFSDKIKENLIILLNCIKDITPNEKTLYEILIKCLSDYNKLK